MNYNREQASRTRLVRVRGGSAQKLLQEHPKATSLFGHRYSPAWLLDHVATGRMELWDFQLNEESIGLLAAYVSRVSLVPSYFIWALYVRPDMGKWQPTLWEWIKVRTKAVGCAQMEFVTHRGEDFCRRYLRRVGYDWPVSYSGFVVEV